MGWEALVLACQSHHLAQPADSMSHPVATVGGAYSHLPLLRWGIDKLHKAKLAVEPHKDKKHKAQGAVAVVV